MMTSGWNYQFKCGCGELMFVEIEYKACDWGVDCEFKHLGVTYVAKYGSDLEVRNILFGYKVLMSYEKGCHFPWSNEVYNWLMKSRL